MSIFLRYYLWSVLIISILTYFLGWFDMASNELLSGDVFKDVLNSFPYYVKWVLPYWWVIILIGALILAVFGLIVRRSIIYLKKK